MTEPSAPAIETAKDQSAMSAAAVHKRIIPIAICVELTAWTEQVVGT